MKLWKNNQPHSQGSFVFSEKLTALGRHKIFKKARKSSGIEVGKIKNSNYEYNIFAQLNSEIVFFILYLFFIFNGLVYLYIVSSYSSSWYYSNIKFSCFLFFVFLLISLLFFFKQKTAYEIGVRLVGSEMCIRDRGWKNKKQ